MKNRLVRILREHLAYENVVATLALFVALGGTSYAALQITGRDIRNRTVQMADLSKKARKQLSGVPGPRGPAGKAGPHGVAGLAGPRGAAGRDGAPGERGLEGAPATALWALSDASGNLVRGSHATDADRFSTGNLTVTFDRDVSGCVSTATITKQRRPGEHHQPDAPAEPGLRRG